MSDNHSHIGCTAKSIALYLVPVIAVYYLLKFIGVIRFFQQKIQCLYIKKMAAKSAEIPLVKSTKSELFKSMKDFKNPPTILEVGAGDCRNLEFYPEGSKYIIVEPNENFHDPLTKRVREIGPHLNLQAVHTDYAENLTHVPDASVDAYVMTHVMCCVRDVAEVLCEARRVLKTGGRLYIYHHFLGPNINQTSLKARLERYLLYPLFSSFMPEGNCDRHIEADIRRYFPDTTSKTLEIPYSFITMRYHLVTESVKT